MRRHHALRWLISCFAICRCHASRRIYHIPGHTRHPSQQDPVAKQIFQPTTTPPRRIPGPIAFGRRAGRPPNAALQDLSLHLHGRKKRQAHSSCQRRDNFKLPPVGSRPSGRSGASKSSEGNRRSAATRLTKRCPAPARRTDFVKPERPDGIDPTTNRTNTQRTNKPSPQKYFHSTTPLFVHPPPNAAINRTLAVNRLAVNVNAVRSLFNALASNVATSR